MLYLPWLSFLELIFIITIFLNFWSRNVQLVSNGRVQLGDIKTGGKAT